MNYEKDICFLVGAQRSGTTWIQRLLQSHPSICGGEEGHFFTLFGEPLTMAQRMISQNPERKIGPLVYTTNKNMVEGIRGLWQQTYEGLYSQNKKSSVHLEKTPDHALHLESIAQVFPKSKIIFVTRDSRAVVSSILAASNDWGKHWAPSEARDASIQWHRFTQAARRWIEKNPTHSTLIMKYEDFVTDFHKSLSKALTFALPDGTDLHTETVLESFKMSQDNSSDPFGFNRKRGVEGWKSDLTLFQKLTVWRYTRKEMAKIGYSCTITD